MEPWLRLVRSIFLSALKQELGDDRVNYVNKACGSNNELRQQVERLLAIHEAGQQFLQEPVLEWVADIFECEDDNADLTGQMVGPYKVLHRLDGDRGGMGEIWLADDDPRLERKVALKFLRAEARANYSLACRLTQEAKDASLLNHPNIITIYAVGDHNGTPYIASEFVEGESLRQTLKNGQLPFVMIVNIASQIADGLAAAHAAGVIHRDIKPENIMVRPDGHIKVLDFGIARRLLSEPLSSAEALRATSQPTVIEGTPRYMSPEQVLGHSVDARTDIWSLGVLLYEMVTGRSPFEGGTSFTALAAAILEREPSPLSAFRKGGIPSFLLQIIDKALKKNPEERYYTVTELRADLRRCSASTTQLKWKNKRAVLIGMATLCSVAVILFFLIHRSSSKTFQIDRITPLTNIGTVVDAAISPDGAYFAFITDEANQRSLRLGQVSEPGSTLLVPPSTAEYNGLTFSPDGQSIYYVQTDSKGDGTLFVVPLVAGTPRRVRNNVDSPISFAPDGNHFAFVRGNLSGSETSLIVAELANSGERTIAVKKAPDQLAYTGAAWSPKGDSIACSAFLASSSAEGHSLAVLEFDLVKGTEQLMTSQSWQWAGRLAWLKDGSGLLLSVYDLGATVPHLVRLPCKGCAPERLVTDPSSFDSVTANSNSNLLTTIRAERLSGLWVAPVSHLDQAKRITPRAGTYYGMAWMPDGQLITQLAARGRLDLWLMNVQGDRQEQLTNDNSSKWAAKPCLNDRYIVYSSDRAGTRNIWRMDADGMHSRLLTTGPGTDVEPECTQDGWVVFTSYRSGKCSLWKVRIDGGLPTQIHSVTAKTPAVSPDGKFVACKYQPGDIARWSIAILALSDGKPVRYFNSLPPDTIVRWSGDGKGLYYSAISKGRTSLWFQPIAGSTARRITDLGADTVFWFDWSRDGKWLAYVSGATVSNAVLIRRSPV